MFTKFPIIGTKIKGASSKTNFNLSDPTDRKAYFKLKIGEEIQKLNRYLEKNTFVGNIVGKKNSGKGTYVQMLIEVLGTGRIVHLSVGDMVRDIHADTKAIPKLKKYYRGFISFEEAMEGLTGSSTQKLAPTEAILALLKYNIEKHKNKAIFLDGLPRETDQVSYSLFLRDLINFRNDPDFFVLLETPEAIIDARIKSRLVCPNCHASKNLRLNPTKFVEYDKSAGHFILLCENPACKKVKLVRKEGDDLGVEPIRPRLIKDDKILELIFGIHGVPKIFLRNSIPVAVANKYFDDYEYTPEYKFELDSVGQVITKKTPWIFPDDEGCEAKTLLPAATIVCFVKQMVDVLEI
ncbi:hypothetical protein A2872_02120 [Candidatus Gottesmanbacteria bacterium RIFCSPHIGHO2_01_FULL_42_12]|uniref:Adenylate kinase n=1 Tax=Candidatus Gottesmanbacteria bacterium RIFCSPHIGHO2_01_FULL_42_12 TaxID=1798377 RepID=A0A1F5Z5L9_9BACT|nr:MAG: hypothetical protein A2872_02120 [Candidatus Gottesmanbacteria bacterium RIFCSPHIGHO2_01_FULL_42_12]